MQIMGILNLTPDSFVEESRYNFAVLEDRCADIVDVGAVSTRPGAAPVSADEEWSRIEGALPRLVTCRRTLSLDTVNSETVKRFSRHFKYFIVNDISAGEDDPDMLPTVAGLGLGYVAMHKRGTPRTMDTLCPEGDIIGVLKRYFEDFGQRAAEAGLDDWILDPGLGFAKTAQQCLEILDRLEELKVFGKRILVGASRKRFTQGIPFRAEITAARSGADILRVHDPSLCRRALEEEGLV